MVFSTEETITVTSKPRLVDRYTVGKPAPSMIDQEAFQNAVQSLRQGTTGGVRPLDVEIPKTGKVLLLTGVLPPADVTAELAVRRQRR